MVEVCSISQQQQQNVVSSAAPPPPRRPRVREVSSRFMSPVVSSSSSGDLHLPSSKCPLPKHSTVSTSTEIHPKHHHHHPQFQRSKSAHKREEEQEPLSCADENRLDTARSLDTPLGSHSKLVQSMQRKSQRAVKLFKENNGGLEQQHSDALHHLRTSINGKLPTRTARSRPDTPVVDRMNHRSVISTPHSQRLANISVASAASTAAAKLVQSSGMSAQTSARSQVTSSSSQASTSMSVDSSNSDYDDRCSENNTEHSTSSESFETEICSSPKIPVQKSKMRSFPDVRSSMPEVDMVPSMSSRLLAQRDRGGGNGIGDSSKVASSPFYRYMNTPLSSCEQRFSSPTKSVYRSSSFLPKPHPSSIKSSNVNMTPHPSNTMSGVEARKGKKVSSHQEDVHALRMLHNRYLQWRYSNAKAEVTMNAQTITAESSLYGIVTKISEMRDSVKLKRTELELLKRTEVLSNILDAQESPGKSLFSIHPKLVREVIFKWSYKTGDDIYPQPELIDASNYQLPKLPHLDDWSAMEGDYSTSLLGVTKALRDASLRLPICGNVRADMREVGGALNSASNLMEILSSHVESFLPKAEEVDSLVSELAAVVSRERALIEECGDLLSKTQMLQVEECSLRGQLMQLKRINLDQAKEQEQ